MTGTLELIVTTFKTKEKTTLERVESGLYVALTSCRGPEPSSGLCRHPAHIQLYRHPGRQAAHTHKEISKDNH